MARLAKCIVAAAVLAFVGCGGAEAPDESWAAEESAAVAKIDVNAATMAQLAALPGMSGWLAGAVVGDRDLNGPFYSTTELRRVPGVGKALYAKISTRIKTTTCGGARRVRCSAGLVCMPKSTAASATGVCVPARAASVTLVPAGRHFGDGERYLARVLYGYTDRTAADFARAADKGSLPWYANVAARTPGHLVAAVRYGANAMPNDTVRVPAQGRGVLYRFVWRCRVGTVERDCDESPIAYAPAVAGAGVQWAGSWTWRPFHAGTNPGGPVPDDLSIGSQHYAPSIVLELWAPGITDNPVSDVGLRVELETDLNLSQYDPDNHLAPGGVLRHFPMTIDGRSGNNWTAVIGVPYYYNAVEIGRTYKYRARLSTDGGRTWVYAGRGSGLSETWRTWHVNQ